MVTVGKTQMLELVANVSMLFNELPYVERFSAAAAVGFQGAETWWPFLSPTPHRDDLAHFVSAIDESGIPLIGLNLFAGDMAAGDRGVICRQDRRQELAANLDAVVEIANLTGCRVFNALYGQHQPGAHKRDEESLALTQLAIVARRVDEVDGIVLIEPLTVGTAGAYPVRTAADAMAIVHRVRDQSGAENIGLLFDTFHLANNGDDLIDVVDQWGADIAHVQIADAPGRGEPGTGSLPIASALNRLWDRGYRRAVAGEYIPGEIVEERFDWIESLPHVTLNPQVQQMEQR